MDIFLIILAGILLLLGIAGSVLPVLPGLPLSYVGLLVLQLTEKVQFSATFLILWAVIVVFIQVFDYSVPIWGTKKFGGSQRGIWGSGIGLFLGLFFGPIGIITGPFMGAFIGEISANKNIKEALRAAFGAFVGFIIGTVSKLVVGAIMLYYYISALVTSGV